MSAISSAGCEGRISGSYVGNIKYGLLRSESVISSVGDTKYRQRR
jgi:hypothetical protein